MWRLSSYIFIKRLASGQRPRLATTSYKDFIVKISVFNKISRGLDFAKLIPIKLSGGLLDLLDLRRPWRPLTRLLIVVKFYSTIHLIELL